MWRYLHFQAKCLQVGSMQDCIVMKMKCGSNIFLKIRACGRRTSCLYLSPLTFLEPSANSVLSLKISIADRLHCNLYENSIRTQFCNSLQQTRKSFKCESFDLLLIFMRVIFKNKQRILRSAWHFSTDHSEPNRSACGTKHGRLTR